MSTAVERAINMANQKTPEIYRMARVVEKTGFCRAWIYVLMNRGEFPKARKIGKRAIGFSSVEIDAWIAERIGGE